MIESSWTRRDGIAVPLSHFWARFRGSVLNLASRAEQPPDLRNVLLAFFAAGLVFGCNDTRDPDLLATYEGGEVRVAQLDEMLRALPAAQLRAPKKGALDTWLEERITDLVLPEILWARAQAGEESEIESPALSLRVRFLAAQEAGHKYLADQCPEEEISEEDLRDLFSQVALQAPRPWILLRHIYKRSRGGAERSAIRQELEALQSQLVKGASFIELARQHSDSETAEEGGLIGRVSKDAPMAGDVLRVAWDLEDGEVSKIVDVENGFHLLFRESSGVESASSFEELRKSLAERESLRRREVCGREVFQRLAEETPSRIEPTILAPDSPDTPVLWVGKESFDAAQLAGLTTDGTPLALSPRPREFVKRLVESLLLASAFSAESPEQATELEKIEKQTRRRLLVEIQWTKERELQVSTQKESELRQAFEKQPERFFSDAEIDLGLILVRSSELGQRRVAFDTTDSLFRRIKAGETFEALAREASEHPSAEDGGRLGPMPLPRLRIVLGSRGINQAVALKVGEVSAPVMIQDAPAAAFALLKIYERIEPQPRTFEEAREDLIAVLASDRIRQLDEAVRLRVKAEAGLKIWPDAVAEYLAASVGTPRTSGQTERADS